MTLIMGAACSDYAVMVSDRLVSLQSRRDGRYLGDHDTAANKCLIVRFTDATVAIGYSGAAYLNNGMPTDYWLAQALAESTITDRAISQSIPRRTRSFAASLYRLRSKLRSVEGGDRVTLVVTGFRARRGRTMPVLLRFSSSGIGRGTFLGMRPFLRDEVRVQHVGVWPNPRSIRESMAPFARNDGFAIGVDEQAAIFASVIRETAAQEKSVGLDLMEIRMSTARQPAIVCRFLSPDPNRSELADQIPKLFAEDGASPNMITLWLISLDTVYPPTVFLGGGPANYRLSWVDVQVVAAHTSTPIGNLSISPMLRKPAP